MSYYPTVDPHTTKEIEHVGVTYKYAVTTQPGGRERFDAFVGGKMVRCVGNLHPNLVKLEIGEFLALLPRSKRV